MQPARQQRPNARVFERRQLSRAGTIVVSLAVALGCAPPPPKAANPVHPVDEPRAVRIIANAFRDFGMKPMPKRTVTLGSGRPLDIDVGASQHQWGVAYVTEGEKRVLNDATLSSTSADSLVVLRGRGADSNTRILILLSENYMSDDAVGDEREASTVAAEHRIARDVRDFIVQAESEKWP